MATPSPRRHFRLTIGSLVAAAALSAAACGSAAPPSPKMSTITHDDEQAKALPPLAKEAIAGVDDAGLQTLLAEHWDFTMRTSPTWATQLGDHRFDDQLDHRDPQSIAAVLAARQTFLQQARALPTKQLSARDGITLSLFILDLESAIASESCHFEQWKISAQGSVLGDMAYMVESHPKTTAQDGRNLLARVSQISRVVGEEVANLQRGAAAGRIAGAESIRRNLKQLDEELLKSVEKWSIAAPAYDDKGFPEMTAALRLQLQTDLKTKVTNEVMPAFRSLQSVMREQLLPKARVEKEGLAGLADGAACYRSQILNHLGVSRDPAEIHQLGLAAIAKTDQQLKELGVKAFGNRVVPLQRLRTDKSLYFSKADEIVAVATSALARAKAAIPRFFRTLPKADCVVAVIPEYEAPYSTIAYYRQPRPDGSKPGEYFVNTYQPEVRARFEMEVLTWHESIPGHHLQIAIAQELGELPAFRKHGGSTAFVEGWALYTEQLAEEMGLYSGVTDRLGKVSFDAWRSARLVVDTGLHHLGWTRKQAEDFMRAHTALTETNIVNEVDRYIGWPGQALGYKVGQLEILRLRAMAEHKLGAAFSLPDFHEVVLGAGAVTLPVLAARVEQWVNSRR
jgi:uncharacterized protein (DUF885 family)